MAGVCADCYAAFHFPLGGDEMIETSEAISVARSLLGTPYSELDCINLIKKIYPALRNEPKGFGKHIIKKIKYLNIAKKGAYDDIIYGK